MGIKKINGIINSFTIIDNLEKYNHESLEKCFNKIAARLEKHLKETTFALDSTIVETNKDFPGCGVTKKKNEDAEDTDEYIYGFKLFILYEIVTRIPIAMTVVPANKSDADYFLPMIKKGIENVGSERVRIIVADRGFIDGYQLWYLKQKLNIDFILPVRTNMSIAQDARKFRKEKEEKSLLSEWKYGKSTCKGYSIEGLLTYIQYNDKNVKSNKDTNGTPINAAVVTEWRGKKVAEGKEKVFITSLPDANASKILQFYRLRSYIENSGFRELKQASFLSKIPKRKGAGAENIAYIHIMLCVIAHTLYYAFLSGRTKGSNNEKEKTLACMRKFRRDESKNNLRNIIVLAGKYYALFTIWEILSILGVEMKCNIGILMDFY